jgi:hypothetical protein
MAAMPDFLKGLLHAIRRPASVALWPETMTEHQFVKRCNGLFKSRGWAVKEYEYASGSRIRRGNEAFYVGFISPQRMDLPTTMLDLNKMFYDLVGQKIIVVSFDPPSEQLKDFTKGRGVSLYQYCELPSSILGA